VRGNAVRVLLPVAAVLALIGVVAVASTGSTPSGSADGRPPADVLLDTLFSFALLLFLPALAILVYGLAQRKEIAREVASGRYRRTGLLAYLVFMGLFTLAVYFRLTNSNFRLGDRDAVVKVVPSEGGKSQSEMSSEHVYEPEFAWIPVLVVLALVATGIVAYVLAARRRKHATKRDVELAEHVAETLEDTLDDLRAEPDPRRAVIAAWARLEQALGASGLPRRPAETPEEYVTRILGGLEVDPGLVHTMTGLYETAKFSHHEVDEGMRESAISAFVAIRDELREAALRRRDEQEGASEAPTPAVAP
jgi:hypothetical protein